MVGNIRCGEGEVSSISSGVVDILGCGGGPVWWVR